MPAEESNVRICLLSILLALACAAGASAQSPAPRDDLSAIGFLGGSWTDGAGAVSETGQTSRGSSIIESAVGGHVLIRRDHTDLYGKDGRRSGSFEQLMMIYPEGGTLRADYSDGEHVIHYTSATVVPGRSVTFQTAIGPGPAYRLTYELADPRTLSVRFEIQPPGQTGFRPIATGTLRKAA